MDNRFESFTTAVLKLGKLIQKIKLHEIKAYGLKAIHVMCIYYLHASGKGLTASELVKLTLEDKAAISRALLLLREKGFVKYDPNKYSEIIKLTEEGIKLAGYINLKAEKAVDACSASLSDGERQLFYNSLGAVTENLEKYYKELTDND